jgi:hypothetical protein
MVLFVHNALIGAPPSSIRKIFEAGWLVLHHLWIVRFKEQVILLLHLVKKFIDT